MTTAAAEESISAEEIVDRYVEARGGLDRAREIKSLRESGIMSTGPHRTAQVTRERKRPNWSRFLFTVQGITSVYVSDGTTGWPYATARRPTTWIST